MDNNKKNPKGFIPKHGGYRKLKSYQKAEIIYDGTIYFTKRFFRSSDRTVDQMVQAARSGKQNIAEASMASATSKETEIKLTNVARASLEELRIDYEDFIRKSNYQFWDADNELVARLRELNKIPDATYETFRKAIEHENPEICANTMIGLIQVAGYLLKNQIKSLEEAFVNEGGLREKMTKVRIDHRNSNGNQGN